jgi:DNA-binding transcriptional ArsR family regulator
MVNMSDHHSSGSENLAELFQLIGQPIRIQILLAIGDSEACVCHLEAVTGLRQAIISQHLMLLRKARLVTPNRAGRNIFYRLENPALLALINTAASMLGIGSAELLKYAGGKIPGCPCPKCEAADRCKITGEMDHD